jgi:A/G-specific adenine glycosylase
VAAIAFDEPAAVVDGNVERVMARIAALQTPLPDAKPELAALAARLTPDHRAGDYAQAVMDLGATICTPRNPACALCPWREACRAHALGIAASLPRRRAKAPKPTRSGHVWVVRRTDGAVLLERRPPRGLLGGMLVWPGAGWLPAASDPPETEDAPAELAYAEAAAIRHTFTHFHLDLRVFCATAPPSLAPKRGSFLPGPQFRPSDLPSVMRKAWDSAQAVLDTA